MRGLGMRLRPLASLSVASSLALVALSVAMTAPAQDAAGGRQGSTRNSAVGYPTTSPSWHFSAAERRVKLVVLAGSIGAWGDDSYPHLVYEWCPNVEVRNLSRVGHGSPQLASRFRSEVLRNSAARSSSEGHERWVMFGGGLNSVGNPQRNNQALYDLVGNARANGYRVVALSVTPWGSATDTRRWGSANGLRTFRNTRASVDFTVGRTPRERAFGPNPPAWPVPLAAPVSSSAPWRTEERPDVAVDLYDSRLRHRDATAWPIERTRAWLTQDSAWRRSVAALSETERQARLEADARELADVPRWFLRPDYTGFDAIHPNRAGHRVIAETICPSLPANWGCRCPAPGSSTATAPSRPAPARPAATRPAATRPAPTPGTARPPATPR